MEESRTKNTIRNVKTGAIVQIINKLMAFVVRTVFIKMLNSINNKPLFQNGVPITTKKDKKGHGIGIKSILKIVKKYHGNLDYTYIENENIFVTTILLKST